MTKVNSTPKAIKGFSTITWIFHLLLVVNLGCTNNKITKTEWLIGTWEYKTPSFSLYENWQQLDEKTLKGYSYRITGSDTLVMETIRIVREGDKLLYIPLVRDQNDGQKTRFNLSSISDTSMEFENAEHDFPQSISYTHIGVDSLVAEISGVRNEGFVTRSFPMKKLSSGKK